jgi:transcription initiation factor TFIIIB Brf1 subunit/transcription initiation factor TFIIB
MSTTSLNITNLWKNLDKNNFYKNFKNKKDVNQDVCLENSYQDIMNKILCKNCGEYSLVNNSQIISCSSCGVIMDDIIIDEGNECRFYHHDDNRGSDPSRCGMPSNDLMPTTNMSTSIDVGKNYIYKLHNHMSYSHKERDRIKVFSDIDNICVRLKINNCITQKAKFNYCMIKDFMEEENDIKRKKNRKGIIGTCIYNACDDYGCPIRESDIARELGLAPNYISRGIKIYGEICNKKNIIIRKKVSQSNDALYFLESFCSILQFNNQITQLVKKIIEKVIKFKVATEDHTPEAQTAGSIWFVVKKCGFDKSRPKSFIHQKVDVSEVTIARAFEKIKAFDEGNCPHRDDRNTTKCKYCSKYKPKNGCLTKYINEYLNKYNEDNNNIDYLISGAEIAEEKVKKKRGRKPKIKVEN